MDQPLHSTLETLDPEDWAEFRDFAHHVLDDAVDRLAVVRDTPVWQPVPQKVRQYFTTPLPREGQGNVSTYEGYRDYVAPYLPGNIHPRYWGWVDGTGTPLGILTEMLAATLNVNARGLESAPTYLELQVLDWLKEIMGFPAEASGLLVSGGSNANLIGLNVARNAKAPFAVRSEGLTAHPPLKIYLSTETHSSVQKAAELMGLGRDSLSYVPVRDDFCIDLRALRAQIAADGRIGHVPFCVVANAGTVNTGAVDPVAELVSLCRDENIWLHVDGAFGALAILDPAHRDLLIAIKDADSIAFDLHKWAHMPYDVGCILVRDGAAHKKAFSMQAGYLTKLDGGPTNSPITFADFGPQLSRGFSALKVWMHFKAVGINKYSRLIAQNTRQARYLAHRIQETPSLELLAPVSLNIVNFRYRASDCDEAELNELNKKLLVLLQDGGIAVPSSTVLHGQFAIRVSITNHRTRYEDLDALLDAVIQLGDHLTENLEHA